MTDGWVDDAWNSGQVILCGDFNAGPTSQSYQLLARRLADTQQRLRHRTWLSILPVARIDHIFTSIDDFDVLSTRVIDSQLARQASDHLPLVAEIVSRVGAASDMPSSRFEERIIR